jgi:hypothetical protein
MDMKKYIIAYVTDNNDLYYEILKNKKAVDKYLEEDIEEYKAIVFTISEDKISITDRT